MRTLYKRLRGTILIASLGCLALTARAQTDTRAKEDLAPLHCDTTWIIPSGKTVELVLNVSPPHAAQPALRQAVAKWFHSQYALLDTDTTFTGADFARFLNTNPLPQSSPDISTTGKKKKRKQKKTRNQTSTLTPITDAAPRYVMDVTLEDTYENSLIITFKYQVARYRPGLPGTTTQSYATFIKKTGKVLTWNDIVLPKYKKRFATALSNNLQQYFGVHGFTALRDKLRQGVTSTAANMPYPQAGPAITTGGIYASYAAGEITTTPMEEPVAFVPLQQVRTYLTAWGKKVAR